MTVDNGRHLPTAEGSEPPAPAVFTWRKGLALLFAAAGLWLLSMAATTTLLDLFGRP